MSGVEDIILSGVFNKTVRPFLDAIDNLRQYGLDEDLQLPTVVVIGDQSSGKSSILEAISGVQLPRGTGMVTKCPLQLQMKQSKQSTEWKATMMYTNKDDENVKKILKDPLEVDIAIRQAQEDMIGDGDSISDSLLSLSIEDANVPDLTLIDLPGIARVSVGNQSEDLPEQIINLLRKFIKRKESIILTVCPCTTDLATTEALKLAQEYDPDCVRTFGVLTKADLIDKGSEDSILNILNNEVVPLVKGYTIVKCRSQMALTNKESLYESVRKEKQFFENHNVFRSLDKSQWGVHTLSKKLAYDLFTFIKDELPNIRKTILEKLNTHSDELNRLVLDFPTTPETRLMFSIHTTFKFLNLFKDLTDGKYHSLELEDVEMSIKTDKKKKDLKSIGSSVPKPDMRLIPHARKLFDDLQSKMSKVTPENSLGLTIQELLITGQGKEPRDFLSFDTFKKIALKFVRGTQPHITSCVETIYNNIQLVLQHMMDYFFLKYPLYKSNFAILVLDLLKKSKDRCFKDMQLMLDKEKVLFTMDKIYEEKIDSLLALQDIKYAMRPDWLKYFVNPPQQSHGQNTESKPKHEEQLPKYVVVYYLLAIRRISDQVSQSILYFLMSDLHSTLNSKLTLHSAQPDTYNLIEEATEGIHDRKKILKLKLNGLKKGVVEIERLLFTQSFSKTTKKRGEDNDDDEEDEDEDGDGASAIKTEELSEDDEV